MSGFTLRATHRIQTLNVEVQSYLHEATGARHFHLACEDDNNAFMVAFPTIPEDSTGVAHILEHTTLCGSARYPVRDPFFMMLRRSLNTFMNAFTSSDSTAYPFATRNRRDFDNLLAIYLDAVFFPNLDPLDFAQEGCRIEFAQPQDPSQGLVYKGVVFNEMKGAMSSPIARLYQYLQSALLPDTAYRFNSGGEPAEIPNLSHGQLRAFHARHYHPSQAVFLTYGSFPVLDHQTKIEALALARFNQQSQIVVAAPQPLKAMVRRVDETYPVDSPEDAEQATHLVWAWLLGPTTDPRTLLEAHLVSGVLLDHSASPLRHLLETTPLARAPSELCGIDDSARQLAFMCGVEGSEAEHGATLEKQIFELFEQLATHGLAPPIMHAALDRIEMAQRDISGDHYPYGLQLMSRMLPAALYRADPIALLDIDTLLSALRKDIEDPAYIKRLLRNLLVDNAHRVAVTMRPDLGRREREQVAEAARLQTLFTQLNEADRAQIAVQAAALATRQARIDDPEILPKLTLADVPAAVTPVTGTVHEIRGRQVHRYVRGTNGLAHVQWVYPLPALDLAELTVLPLFAAYLLDFGTDTESYLEAQLRRASLGQFACSSLVRSHPDSVDRHHARLVLSSKGLRRHTNALCDELAAILARVRFDETDRLRDLLAQTRADLEMGITDRGHSLAMLSAARGLSRSAWLADLWDGPTHLRAMQALDDEAGNNPRVLEDLFARFAAIRARLLQETPQVLLVGETESLDLATDALNRNAPAVTAPPAAPFVVPPGAPAPITAWVTNTEVNFCAQAYPAVPEAHPDAPALAVLSRYLADGYLHAAIREKGGAYGGGASFDADSGCFFLYSYRDPRLVETFDDFDRTLSWFAEHRDDARLEESILGVIRSLDKPRSPAGAAIDAFYSNLQGRTPEFRANVRARVLSMQHTELQRVAERYLSGAGKVASVVTHADTKDALTALGFTIESL